MTNTTTNLREELQAKIPFKVTPIMKATIEALKKLPGLENWMPSNVNWFEVIQLVKWGFPLTFFDESSLLHPLLARMGTQIIADGKPDPNDYAEISVMALLVACGATMVQPLEISDNRSHDFDIQWDDRIVEVEVTRAGEKPAHIERREFASNIANEVFNYKRDTDIIIHIQDIISPAELQRLMDKAKMIGVGDKFEEVDKWVLYAEKPNRPADQLIVGGQNDPPPTWWPIDAVNMFCFAQTVAGPETQTSPPQVRVNYTVPLSGYINPAKKKSVRFQGSRKRPFVIAIDVSVLPKPFDPFRLGLVNLFPNWKHISGILLFRDIFSYDKLGWTWEIFPNEHAIRPLPSIMLENMPATKQSRETFKFLNKTLESDWISSHSIR